MMTEYNPVKDEYYIRCDELKVGMYTIYCHIDKNEELTIGKTFKIYADVGNGKYHLARSYKSPWVQDREDEEKCKKGIKSFMKKLKAKKKWDGTAVLRFSDL